MFPFIIIISYGLYNANRVLYLLPGYILLLTYSSANDLLFCCLILSENCGKGMPQFYY